MGVVTQGTIRTESPNWQAWLTFFLRALVERGALNQPGSDRGVWYDLR